MQQSLSIKSGVDLGEGLRMRRSTPADAGRLSAFNARIHGEDPRDAAGVAAWTRDLLEVAHPTFKADDFLIVENTQTGEIVSSLNLISQTWTYAGIPFKVGRPELVGTDPAYRGRGLVRRQFEIIHQWSRERGELVQVITGIPFFYRQFGYEMGLNLSGGRAGYEPQVPKLKEGQSEPYQVRLAQEADLPFLMRMYQREARRSLVSAAWDEALWRYEISSKSRLNINRWEPCVIETPQGQPVGYLVHPGNIWGSMMPATRYELDEGVSYLAVTPTVIRYLWNIGLRYAADWEHNLQTFGFWLGEDHPVYQVISDRLPFQRKPYAYYVRVPDLPAFLRQVAPALEERLRSSACASHSGELKISFYRSGIRLVFTEGRLVCAEDWQPHVKEDEGAASFPNLTFLQMVFGYRTFDEIQYAYADAYASQEARVLLQILFPRQPSNVWAIS